MIIRVAAGNIHILYDRKLSFQAFWYRIHSVGAASSGVWRKLLSSEKSYELPPTCLDSTKIRATLAKCCLRQNVQIKKKRSCDHCEIKSDTNVVDFVAIGGSSIRRQELQRMLWQSKGIMLILSENPAHCEWENQGAAILIANPQRFLHTGYARELFIPIALA